MSNRFLPLAATLACAAPHALAQLEWRHYRPTNTGILGDYVQTIYVDPQDRPWIGAYTPFWEEGGMSHLEADGTWSVVSSFDHPEITSPRFNDIVRDASGILWIGGNGGLLRFDPNVGASSLVRFDRFNSPLPGNQIVDLDLAPDGTLWIAVHNVSGSPQGGLVRYTPSTDAWQVWTTANGLTWGGGWPGWDAVGHVAVRPDAGGGGGYTVWFDSPNTLGMGTWRNGSFTWLGNPQNPPPGRYPIRFMSNDPIDDASNLWVLTSDGLARRDAADNELVVGYPAGLSTEVSRVVALSGGRAALGTYYADVFRWSPGSGWAYLGNWGSGSHTYVLTEDSTGALWAGGIGGSSKYVNGAWQRHRLTNSGMVGFFTETIDFAPDGRVFMNGNAGPGVGGWDVFDGTRWTSANDATYGLGLAWGIPSDDVAAICYRANGHLAIAPAGLQGLLDWDGSSYTYLLPQGFDLLEVDEDGLQRLWAVHYGNGGITRLTGTQTVHYGSSNSPLPAGSIGSVEVDEGAPGYVWITTQFGIAHTNGDTWTVYPRELLGLTQNTLTQLLECAAPHPDGSLWIGSHNGLYHFDPSTSQYTRYHPGNSALPSNDVNHVHVAPDGSVWVATFDTVWPYPGGLTHFEGGSSTHYDTSNSPLPHNQISVLNSRPIAAGYELWVGTASEAIAVIKVTAEGVSYCSGDGSGTPCPCFNSGAPEHGCENSANADGAVLSASGSTSIGAGNLVLHGAGLVPNQPGLYFQGVQAVNGGAGTPFGDGLRCAGGDVHRIQIVFANASGASSTSVNVAARGGVAPADVRRYQLWYRDPAIGPCGQGFNLTNGLELVWEP